MKNYSISPFYRSRSTLNILTILTLALSITIVNVSQAQQTLCQQIGGNFVPDITIGVNDFSETLSSNLGITGWDNQKVVINGTFVINSNFQINYCSLKMGKKAKIRIDPNIVFSSFHSKYFHCGDYRWTGFVAMGGNSTFFFNHIEDASIALNIKSNSASVLLIGNYINRNWIGLNATDIAVNAILAYNRFDCTSALNGTISGSFAGVQLIDCPSSAIGLTINEPTARNIFKKQQHAINLQNSTTTIGLSTFYDNIRGVLAENSVVTIQGSNAGLTTNFSQNGYDVYTTKTNLNVSNCYMDSCEWNNITCLLNNNKEQIHIHDNTIHVTNEPEPSHSKFGISLDRSKFGNDDVFRNTIDRNHLVIHDFVGNNRRGMHIRGGASIHDFMRIDSNTIEAMTGGNSGIQTKFIDIDISAADNFKVTRNTIRSTNTFAAGNNRWGIFMVNGATSPAEGNVLWNNNILGIGPDDGCCAIHAEDAGPWSICSNTTDHTYRGFHFIGHCGKSSFGLNTMNDHNLDPLNLYVGGTGLLLQGHGADNAFLGDQLCQENYWAVTDYSLPNAYTAILLGNNLNGPSGSTIQNNEFKVENINDPHQAPIDRNPMENWFLPFQCLQTPTECVLPDVNNFDEHDEWVRDNYPFPQVSPGVEEWQSTRYLLAKLMRYPNLATGDALSFKNAYNQSSAALFARFDSLINDLSASSTGSQITLNNLEANIQSKQAEINTLDASILDFENLEPGLLSSRAVLLNELAVLSDQRNVLLTQNTSALAPLLIACEQFNNTLPANQVYEQNQKLLNALSIQQMRGIEFSQTDKDALHAIAQQCTQVAGRTKSAAVAMLPPAEGAQYWRENPDADNCPEQIERDASFQTISLSLSPNPCTDMLHVQFDTPFVGDLIISDLSGRDVQHLHILDKSLTLDIPVGHLNNGVYFLSSTTLLGKPSKNIKFVVLR